MGSHLLLRGSCHEHVQQELGSSIQPQHGNVMPINTSNGAFQAEGLSALMPHKAESKPGKDVEDNKEDCLIPQLCPFVISIHAVEVEDLHTQHLTVSAV